MKMTITEEHLERALQSKLGAASTECLIAQAAKDLFGPRFNGCASSHISLDDYHAFFVSDEIKNIINDFDEHKYDSLRKRLPLTIDIGESLTTEQYNARRGS